ncbi:late embryogenesis abundant protein 7-like [Trifolium pratense]|uniref:late embryogenesis abundant protein 7-like n=1 Tax=Trifolium pratense TaxID=57577 RepID=UPI001E695C7C|nr:late embryogenesis abundant protein 7-like [Trifolium pratense]
MSSAQQHISTAQAGQNQDLLDSTKQTASAAADKAHAAANTTGQAREENQQQAAGFLQQTGEQVKSMAQGAADSVKHALGMDGNSNNSNAASDNSASSGNTASTGHTAAAGHTASANAASARK